MVALPNWFQTYPMIDLDPLIINKITNTNLHCGFPSPAADYESERIDLIKELVPNPEYSEYVRTIGDCCIDRGILDPGFVIVDYSELPLHDDLVYVRFPDSDSIRVYSVEQGTVVLRTANKQKNYPPIYLSKDETVEIRGVVITIINRPRELSRRNVRNRGHQ